MSNDLPKGVNEFPLTTGAALRSLYMESLDKNNPISYFLDLLSDAEAKQAAKDILLEEVQHRWAVVV